MLPLCTSVTESRFAAMAYSIALRTRRFEPNSDIGLMPIAEFSRIFAVVRRSIELRNSITCVRAVGARRPLDARVHVLGVLAEDDHVHLLRLVHRRGHAVEVAHRPHAGVEVEHLAQRDVQRADAAADRRGERALDRDAVVREVIERLLRQLLAELLEGLVAGEDLVPVNLALAAVDLLDRAVDDVPRRAPDVGAGAVAFDVRDDRIVRDDDACCSRSRCGCRRSGARCGQSWRAHSSEKSQSRKVAKSQRER